MLCHHRAARGEHVDLDNVSQFDERTQVFLVEKIVESNGIALRREVAEGCQQVGIDLDIFQHLQHHPVCWEDQGIVLEEEIACQIDKGAFGTDERLETKFEESIHQDLGGGLISIGHTGVLQLAAAKQQFIGKDIQLLRIDGLSAYKDF